MEKLAKVLLAAAESFVNWSYISVHIMRKRKIYLSFSFFAVHLL